MVGGCGGALEEEQWHLNRQTYIHTHWFFKTKDEDYDGTVVEIEVIEDGVI